MRCSLAFSKVVVSLDVPGQGKDLPKIMISRSVNALRNYNAMYIRYLVPAPRVIGT